MILSYRAGRYGCLDTLNSKIQDGATIPEEQEEEEQEQQEQQQEYSWLVGSDCPFISFFRIEANISPKFKQTNKPRGKR